MANSNDNRKGLTNDEVEESRCLYGDNVLTPPAKEPLWKQFLEKFNDPVIRILMVALLLSVAVSLYQYFSGAEGVGVLLEPAGIFIAVMLATLLGFAFEVSAARKFDILNQSSDEEKVTVYRNGTVCQIERQEVVVGDMVIVNTGDEIPADGVLTEALSLQVNESDLTGEPMARKTVVESEFSKDATYPSNYVYRGSKVIEGHGLFIVEKVGDRTEWGRVYRGAQIDNKVKTPLNEQLDKLGKVIMVASYIIASLIIILRMVMYFAFGDGLPFRWVDFARFSLNTLMIAVTVIVVALPEGLPMSVTLSLALSMRRMLETNNLVRKMHACETMGAATVICTDKTGTLTKNQMRVSDFCIYGLHDSKLDDSQTAMLIKEGIAVNSTAYLDFSDYDSVKTLGNPTEAALLLWLFEQNVDFIGYRDHSKVIRQIPFSTQYKYMASVVATEDPTMALLYVKGAPEVILRHCAKVRMQVGETDLSDYLTTITNRLQAYQYQAMRTLGFAYCYVKTDEIDGLFDGDVLQVNDLCYLGTAAIADPIRDDVSESINACLGAGISIKIVTGDTPGTAKEIGRQLGLWSETDLDGIHHFTGSEFDALDDAVLLERVEQIKIISRARPMDKERLVRLLQQHDAVVAVTGDGTNDAPALNAAQIGLSMGDGTSVAKEASDITILDNSFKSITKAVMWGRSLYINIQRFILFQMTVNVAACLIVLLGAVLGTETPLTVTQMLWVNLIMDTFAAMALASLPPDSDVLKDKPRSHSAHIITKDMAVRILGVGLAFVVLLFGLIQYFKHVELETLADFSWRRYFAYFFDFSHVGHGLSPYELTLFFTIFVFMQFWNIFNAKAYLKNCSAFKPMPGKMSGDGFLLTLFVIVAGQVIIVNYGGAMFDVQPISLADWRRIIIGTMPIVLIGELARFIKSRRKRKAKTSRF